MSCIKFIYKKKTMGSILTTCIQMILLQNIINKERYDIFMQGIQYNILTLQN